MKSVYKRIILKVSGEALQDENDHSIYDRKKLEMIADVVKEASMRFNLPVVTYNVSGEYSMVKAAAGLGYIDEKRIVMENLLSMKRAGAKIIITYHALDVARWINSEK